MKAYRARRIIENVFGIIANKFRLLRKPMNLHFDRVTDIVLSICAMHNFLLYTNNSRENYLHPRLIDYEEPGTYELRPGIWKDEAISENTFLPLERGNKHNYKTSQKEVRDEFMEYFVTLTPTGKVECQYKHIYHSIRR